MSFDELNMAILAAPEAKAIWLEQESLLKEAQRPQITVFSPVHGALFAQSDGFSLWRSFISPPP
jgi:hypothetical protein